MNYSRHRLKQKMKKIKELEGAQRERAEQKALQYQEPETQPETETRSEPEATEDIKLDTAPEPKRRGRPKNAN